MDQLESLIRQTRTCRRFVEKHAVSKESLTQLIELARLGGSARNAQPLKYMLVNEPEQNQAIFPLLGWAGYLTDWPGPVEGERPSAYIICLLDTTISDDGDFDLGIASQNILLGATELGLAGCRIASLSGKLHGLLKLPDHLKVLLVIALGKPVEEIQLTEMNPGDSIKYWRDDKAIHHVPKRKLNDIII